MIHRILALFLALTWVAAAQTTAASDTGSGKPLEYNNQHEFAFARLVYNGSDSDGWGPRWQVDWPEAENHLLAGLSRLTRVDANSDGALVQLSDDTIFDYPWLYAVEVGALRLSEYEASRLREYLLRGGFLMVDDFHGPYPVSYTHLTLPTKA